MSRRITQRKRRRKRRGRRRSRRPVQALVKARHRRPRLRVQPGALEIARGYDGLLRGYPEPVLLIATYEINSGALLDRTVVRYERVRALPCVVAAREPGGNKGSRVEPGAAVAVIAVAIEEDSSRDIQKLFSELADAHSIVAWPRDDTRAIPGPLEQLREILAAESVTPLELKIAGRFPSDWFRADDYVAAAGGWLEAASRRAVELEIPARSADGRNDWRARLTIRFS